MSLGRLLNRPDFRASPVEAVYKRVAWRLHWSHSTQPWRLKLGNGAPILVSHTGPGALIYYQGTSEPELSDFMASYLKPGMTFYDLGSHIGEYAIRAAFLVGPAGCVHAFEPQPDIRELLKINVALNRLENVTVSGSAMTNEPGTVEFHIRADRAVSSRGRHSLASPRRNLNSYAAKTNSVPHLIKIDVEGAEHLVLQGAAGLLSAPAGQAPALVLEYCRDNYRAFGVSPSQALDLLSQHLYMFHMWQNSGLTLATSVQLHQAAELNLIAIKR